MSLYECEKKMPPARVPLLAHALFSMMLAGVAALILMGLVWSAGWDQGVIGGHVGPDTPQADLWRLRFALALNHLCVFVLAGWLALRISYRTDTLRYLRATSAPNGEWLLWSIAMMLAAIPAVLGMLQFNQSLPLPDTLRAMEAHTEEAVKALLRMDGPLELLGNLLIIALLPAIGEELTFRGVLQRQLMRRIASPWAAILLSAAIFSAIHLQFGGFLPRFALGALLGWIYWRTDNFWIPVAAHFFNNGLQIVGQYFFIKDLSAIDLEKDIAIPWHAAVLSAAAVCATGYVLAQKIRRTDSGSDRQNQSHNDIHSS